MNFQSHSASKFLVFIVVFAFLPRVAVAWSEDAPNASYKIELNQIAISRSDEIGAQAELKLSAPDLENIAAQIEVELGGAVEARLYVYDTRETLIEVISATELPSGRFWTDLGKGNELTIRLSAFGVKEANLRAHAIAGHSGGGTPDGVPDGAPQFEVVVDEGIERFWAPFAPAVARLVVGQNELPLQAREPQSFRDWCTGFLISSDLLMTVAHCLWGRPVLCEQTVALFGYLRRSKSSLARSCLEVVYFNRLLDIAILKLQTTDVQQSIIELPNTGPADTQLAVIQHPRGAVMLVSQDNCNIVEGRTFSLPYDIAVDERLLAGVGFTHSCDTIHGSSGAPVLAEDVLAGVHQGSTKPTNHAIRALSIARCLTVDSQEQTVNVNRPDELLCRNEM